jgi:hypothetical protein
VIYFNFNQQCIATICVSGNNQDEGYLGSNTSYTLGNTTKTEINFSNTFLDGNSGECGAADNGELTQ